MLKVEFVNGEYYHIFNRGTDKREVFLCEKDYFRFLETIRFVNNEKTYLKETIKLIKNILKRIRIVFEN